MWRCGIYEVWPWEEPRACNNIISQRKEHEWRETNPNELYPERQNSTSLHQTIALPTGLQLISTSIGREEKLKQTDSNAVHDRKCHFYFLLNIDVESNSTMQLLKLPSQETTRALLRLYFPFFSCCFVHLTFV